MRRYLVLCWLLAMGQLAGGASPSDPRLTFEQHIRPILKAHCFECHGEGPELAGGLDLRLKRFLIAGGDSGAAVVADKPSVSLLLTRVSVGEMPPGEESKKLTESQLELIRKWILAGAPLARPEPESLARGFQFSSDDLEFWAFQPIRRPSVPEVQQTIQVHNPVDRFVQTRLEQRGVTLQPAASREQLLRRATFDLLGLPPTLRQRSEFLADTAPDAWQRLIDRLLNSPHYGERWGRHWLDVAGYADSDGVNSTDTQRKWAWRYRDWVVAAHNRDTPWDQFLLEQLAGDELVTLPYENLSPRQIDQLAATGYLRTVADGTGSSDTPQTRNQVVSETLKVVSTSILGLTVGCAQCHNHRYDPIPQEDYYRFRAIFEPALDVARWRKPASRLVSLYTDADRSEAARIEEATKEIDQQRARKQEMYIQRTFDQEVAKLPEALREAARLARQTDEKKRSPVQRELLKTYPSLNVSAGSLYLYDQRAADDLKAIAKRASDLRATKPEETFVRVLQEQPGQVPVTRVFFRGDINQPGDAVPPAGLSVLSSVSSQAAGLPENDDSLPTTGRRLAWARRLTDGQHPLVARVIVNRAWMHLLGRGLVPTPGDWGALGARPTHPQLLDWLADEFMASGWSLKRLHRTIMGSATYQQSAQSHDATFALDPENRLLSRGVVRRLDAESVRDAILKISGALDSKYGGPPVPIMADRVGQWVIGIENLNAGRPGPVIEMQGERYRRSIWVEVRRSRPLAVLDTFDRPAMEPNCTERVSTTVASQSLLMMNSDFVVSQSARFAARLKEVSSQPVDRIRHAWKLVYATEPTTEQINAAVAFVEEQTALFWKPSAKDDKKQPAAEEMSRAVDQAWSVFCQALLSSNRFLYLD
ncbi:MAG: PSD1 and planctomycete cytochrome C domain-containing protein [Planctomycetota bacterium]|nr:PSD1 and planctomycete cytochrome C domain-containing protein [Planctomycetota bacterium]